MLRSCVEYDFNWLTVRSANVERADEEGIVFTLQIDSKFLLVLEIEAYSSID